MEMKNSKKCTRCGIVKQLSEYSMHTKAKDGKQSQCKDCFSERARISRIGKPCISCGNPKEKGVPRGARLCLSCSATCFTCKERPREKQHRECKFCRAKRDAVRNKTDYRQNQQRVTRISSKYKISREFATELSKVEKCEVCGRTFKNPGNRHVDHCHESGVIRGVLCFNCNAALGHLADNQERILMLVKYLSKNGNGIKDLEKARHFIDLLIELESRCAKP